jgi:hypothetical protein
VKISLRNSFRFQFSRDRTGVMNTRLILLTGVVAGLLLPHLAAAQPDPVPAVAITPDLVYGHKDGHDGSVPA